MKKGIAFFDFDGTITSKDSLAEIIKYIYGNFRFIIGIARTIHMIAGFKIGLKDRQTSKESLLTHFFRGMSESEFQEKCYLFSKEIIPQIIRHEAIKKIEWHKDQGHELVLVSASPENWLKDWCENQKMHCIATKLEIKNSYLTGKIAGKNCHGIEKVNRIKKCFDLNSYSQIYAYGDSEGDKNMLSLANFPFYKKLN